MTRSWKSVFTYIGLLFFAYAPHSSAKNSFLVAPGRVEFDLTRPKTQSFIITNNGDDSIRLSINPTYFAVDSDSLGIGHPLSEETKTIEDLTPYILVSPPRLSLKPGQRLDIRISLRPPNTLTEGSYRAHLLVSMMEVAETVTNEEIAADGNSLGMHLSIKMETAVAIYGNKGEGNPDLKFNCLADPESGKLSYEIINESPWRFDGWVRVYDSANSSTAINEDRLIIMRESRRSITSEWKPSMNPLFLRWSDLKTEEQIGSASCPVVL